MKLYEYIITANHTSIYLECPLYVWMPPMFGWPPVSLDAPHMSPCMFGHPICLDAPVCFAIPIYLDASYMFG